MRKASADDFALLDAMAFRAGMPGLSPDLLSKCIVLVGDHGYVVVDPMDESRGIVHVTIDKDGLGPWGAGFLRSAVRWLFLNTRIEALYGAIPSKDRHIITFARGAWFRPSHFTDTYTYLYVDLFGWVSRDLLCLSEGAHGKSDYPLADPEMVKRITGACSMMHESGMGHKAWYIYQLYAKLFGYKAEG